MKNAERIDVYRRAAATVQRKNAGACSAIHWATKRRFPEGHRWNSALSPDALSFQEWFCPLSEEHYFDYWLETARDRGLIEGREMKRWRVLALCFMAAMVEAGDA